MKRAVITGATGALGTALVKVLTEAGIEVLVITRPDSKRNGHILTCDRVNVKYCPLNAYSEIENDTGKEYDVFYHLAWEGTTGADRNDMYMQTRNIQYSLDAVNMAKRFGCRTFIGAGSQAEYGRSSEKLKPDTAVKPETGYGYAKLCAGNMTRDLAHSLEMQHIWVRILSIYGPGDGTQSLISYAIDKIKKNESPRFTKGEQLWDYIFSLDAARAFYLLGMRSMDCKNSCTSESKNTIDGKTYVLGSGNARPLADYITDIRDIVNPGCPVELGAIAYAEKQVMYLCADITELKKDTGFIPETAFADGIRAMLPAPGFERSRT